MTHPYRQGTIAFKITRDDLAERIHAARETLQTLELFAEDAGFREAAKRTYEARLQLSEALRALPPFEAPEPSSTGDNHE